MRTARRRRAAWQQGAFDTIDTACQGLFRWTAGLVFGTAGTTVLAGSGRLGVIDLKIPLKIFTLHVLEGASRFAGYYTNFDVSAITLRRDDIIPARTAPRRSCATLHHVELTRSHREHVRERNVGRIFWCRSFAS
jgi:hypothetical protein